MSLPRRKKFYGIISANPEEARIFRRTLAAGTGTAIILGLFLEQIVSKLERKKTILDVLAERKTVILRQSLLKTLRAR